jgi:hypothetical protein
MMEAVITQDRQELERLEGIIRENVGAFYEIGDSLTKIRLNRYYHKVLRFETFEEYCKARWDFKRSYAKYLIAATSVIDNLSTMATIVAKPVTETQCRPLARLPADQQLIAWQKAVETAPDGKITAAHVYKIVKGMTMADAEVKEKKALRKGCDAVKVDPEFQAAWDVMYSSIKKLRIMNWRTMAQDDAIKRLSALVDVLNIGKEEAINV